VGLLRNAASSEIWQAIGGAGGHLWLASSDGTVALSENGGTTWSSMPSGYTWASVSLVADGDDVWIGGAQRSGTSECASGAGCVLHASKRQFIAPMFAAQQVFAPVTNVHGQETWLAAAGGVAIVGGQAVGDVARSTDRATWMPLGAPGVDSVRPFSAGADDIYAYAGGQAWFRAGDGGWVRVVDTGSDSIAAMSATGPRDVWLVTRGGALYHGGR
jgi:hypothetical protein